MLETAREGFYALLVKRLWAQQLAGILPLSALVDFLNIPRLIHVFELTGRMPLWCWTVTPSGSRLLMSERAIEDPCCLDKFSSGPKPICLDGRHGDMYPMASAETIRMCIESSECTIIENSHRNIESEREKRPQWLELIHVIRESDSDATTVEMSEQNIETGKPSSKRKKQARKPTTRATRALASLLHWSFRENGLVYNAAAALGWVIWMSVVVLAVIMYCWIATVFLVDIVVIGIIVSILYGRKARQPGERGVSSHNRLIVTADHVNDTRWTVFYGESTIVNSLLNWPLLRKQAIAHSILTPILGAAIFVQWALAIGAAATQGWDAYLITFWIIFCIVSQSYVFSSPRCAHDWLKRDARLSIRRFKMKLSSRRALINTIMALNPDTFREEPRLDINGHELYYEPGLLWIEPILRGGDDRWREATRQALLLAKAGSPSSELIDPKLRAQWWWTFVQEGIEGAEHIRCQAKLPGRFVHERRHQVKSQTVQPK